MKRQRAVVAEYFETRQLTRHVRIMQLVMRVVDDDPEMRVFYTKLHLAYMDILQKELAPDALTLALAIAELEDAYPEIKRRREP